MDTTCFPTIPEYHEILDESTDRLSHLRVVDIILLVKEKESKEECVENSGSFINYLS